MFDIVIKNGTVVTGRKILPRTDVGITDGRIEAVGRFSGRARKTKC